MLLTHVLVDDVDQVDVAKDEGWSSRRVSERDEIWCGAVRTISEMALHVLVSYGEGRRCILPCSTPRFLSATLSDLKWGKRLMGKIVIIIKEFL